ncbi:hypothetical protein As57867_002274, partial [Aphanomyces stellatus]
NLVWKNYKGGVVTQCPGSDYDHAVMAVGFGTSTDDFFKIKNSWGAQWGENGFMYLKRGLDGRGMCNIAQSVSYPELTGAPSPTSYQPSSSPSSTTSKPSSTTPTPTTPTPQPSSYSPSTTPVTTPSTTTPTTPVTTTQEPKKTRKPKTCKPKSSKPVSSTSAIPSTIIPSTITPASSQPSTPPASSKAPAPKGDCHGCMGCYSKSLGSCLSAEYTKDNCASYSYFQTYWCGN